MLLKTRMNCPFEYVSILLAPLPYHGFPTRAGGSRGLTSASSVEPETRDTTHAFRNDECLTRSVRPAAFRSTAAHLRSGFLRHVDRRLSDVFDLDRRRAVHRALFAVDAEGAFDVELELAQDAVVGGPELHAAGRVFHRHVRAAGAANDAAED